MSEVPRGGLGRRWAVSCATSAALGGSDRSGVHRATDGTATLVVKAYAAHSLTSWARERVGLGVAGGLGLAPRLLAAPPTRPWW